MTRKIHTALLRSLCVPVVLLLSMLRVGATELYLPQVQFSAGRFVAQNGHDNEDGPVPVIFVTDHLGSVRTVIDARTAQTLETSDYYPFGTRWTSSADLTDATNRYRYNAKEEQTTFGTPYIDYGARQYFNTTGRWLSPDPLAEKYYSTSPYAFCANNPVNVVDPDGRRVRVRGSQEFDMIRRTLPKEAHKFIQTSSDGYINIGLLEQYCGNSGNMKSLIILATSEIIINVKLDNHYKYVENNGHHNTSQMQYIPYDSEWPKSQDINFKYTNGLSTGESGTFGKVLFPDSYGKQNSPNEEVHIIVNSGLTPLGAAEAFSHEAYGHVVLYIKTDRNRKKATHDFKSSSRGPYDANFKLRRMILRARKETVKNYYK